MAPEDTLIADPLFVGVTRPAMKWGVPYLAVLVNLVVTMELFLLSRNLLTLLLAVPLHGVCALLCARDARVFELALLWARTTGSARLVQGRRWPAASYGALALTRAIPTHPSVRLDACAH